MRLRTENPKKLLLSLAIPAICAQIITLLYNMVDRMFIGRMSDGAMAIAAIGLCVPITTVFNALTGLFGRGGAPYAAINMGREDYDKAERYLGNSFACLVFFSILITIIVSLLKKPLLLAFGASPVTLPYALDYLGVYCLGTLFIQLTVGMNYYITTQGFAKTAMMTTIMGGILNIILDPIFIFTLHLGVKGAALASVLAQMLSCMWALKFLFGKRTKLKISFAKMKIDPHVMKDILTLGASPFFMSASEGILHICFNMQILKYGGDLAVAAMTILFSMYQFILLPIEGVASGSQPIISYNYGAHQFSRVKETLSLALKTTIVISVAATLCMLIKPDLFIRIFNSDPDLIAIGVPMLRIYIFGCMLMGANSTFQQTYNSLGAGKYSFFFAFLRKVILLIPLLYLLPAFLPFGVFAVVLAEPISDWITVGCNAMNFRRFLNHQLTKDSSLPS